MREIVDRDEITKKEIWNREKAIEHFKKKGEIYKAELIESIPQGEEVSIYFSWKMARFVQRSSFIINR